MFPRQGRMSYELAVGLMPRPTPDGSIRRGIVPSVPVRVKGECRGLENVLSRFADGNFDILKAAVFTC